MINKDSVSILIVEDDEEILSQLKWTLGDKYTLLFAASRDEALSFTIRDDYQLVLLYLRLPPDIKSTATGFEHLHHFKTGHADVPIIMMKGDEDRATAHQDIRKCVYDFFPKPFKAEELFLVTERALNWAKLKRENRELRERLLRESALSDEIIGRSGEMKEVFSQIEAVAATGASVLITGESGSGKELVARAIHFKSPFKNNSLISFDCATVPETLAENEIFGHEKGAFTGTSERYTGKIEQAHNGTLFMDKIGELSPNLQAKFLRVLQDKFLTRLGGRERIRSNFRLIAATNKNLQQMMEEGKFREDLFYRINVFQINIPPLRNRKGDIPLLVNAFVRKFGNRYFRNPPEIQPDVLDLPEQYHWPGSVHQLENVLERAVILSKGKNIGINCLPDFLRKQATMSEIGPGTFSEIVKECKRKTISQALAKTEGDKRKAAKLMEISESYPCRLIKELKIE